MSNFIKKNWVKILAVVILFGALGNNPYSYYQLLRWAILIIAGYVSYTNYKKQKINWAWTFGIMAILFNPIVPFYLSKNTWQLIDLASGILFLVSIFSKEQ